MRLRSFLFASVDVDGIKHSSRVFAFLFVLGIVSNATLLQGEEKQAALALSGHPQLFLDDDLLAKSDNVKRVLQQPTKYTGNPLDLRPEYAWEQSRMGAGSVVYDETRKTFRMWYPVFMDKSKYVDNFGYVCYAESADGIHWKKPMLKLHAFEGQLPTNIVTKGPSTKESECLFPSVIQTPHDPSRLYKMLFTHRRTSDNPSHYGLHVSTSVDGLHWTEPRFVFQGKCDNPPSLVWSQPLQKYFGYCRAQDSHKDLVGHIRSTGILTSLDFDHWTPRKKVVLTDQRDGYPFHQFHHLMVTQYGDLMIGMADVMHMLTDNNKESTEDVQLISSRDGWNWNRVADRAVFIPNSKNGYDREMVSPRSSLVRANDTIYIYYQASPTGQGRKRRQSQPPADNNLRNQGGVCLATLPADRFVALVPSSADRPAVIQTKPFTSNGQHLLLNAELSDLDGIAVELLDELGNPLPQFSQEQSQLVMHDKLRYRVTWRQSDGTDISLKEVSKKRPVALRFTIRRGALYSFQMKDSL